ncbi:uncharacterized protein LOC135379202 [Ornithodoros turicata]|uniref:uncharacterized protein LOC135379202 n=1 Tax=Ornithodoros turicata TaxID=34597 RepID=UPI003138E7C0
MRSDRKLVGPRRDDRMALHCTWSGKRIRPDRAAAQRRRAVQKLTWKNSHWLQSFPVDENEANPGLAIRRVLLLCERAQFQEAAAFVERLEPGPFGALLAQLPVEVFLEGLPESFPVLEALLTKGFLTGSLSLLKPQAVVFQIVRLMARDDDQDDRRSPDGGSRPPLPEAAMATCKNLLKVIVAADPRARNQLRCRKEALQRALDGLGQHGLVAGGADGGLVSLHDALRTQLDYLAHQYKVAVQTLDELALARGAPPASLCHGPAPTGASHQRQLSVAQLEIQERLIKNKTLLNALEPALAGHAPLDAILARLRSRIQLDKDVLFQFTQLRKEAKDVSPGAVVAPVLVRFTHGCQLVLDLMRTQHEEEGDSSAGYHSDSTESAPQSEGPSACRGRCEVERLRSQLSRARQNVALLEERERGLRERLAVQAQRMLERGVHFEKLSLGERRPTALIRRYGSLYAQARVDTLDALDTLPQLRDADELKSKLLFSVVVLAFRAAQSALAGVQCQVRKVLQVSGEDASAQNLEASVAEYLRAAADRFDVTPSVEEVCTQIWATLYDYPCLKTCSGLEQYVKDCVRLAWALSAQEPPFGIEYETRVFRRDLHVRFHTSDQSCDRIRTYLWPALLEGPSGPCVHKGVVVT